MPRNQPAPSAPSPARRTPRRLDGVTNAEREQPLTGDPQLLVLEQAAADARPDQLELFAPGPGGTFTPLLGGMPVLEPDSSLDLARAWYRRELEQARRPPQYDRVLLLRPRQTRRADRP